MTLSFFNSRWQGYFGLAKANSWLFVGLSIFAFAGYYLITGWLKVDAFAMGKHDTATWQTALWQAGQFQNPITYAFPGTITYPFVANHWIPIGFVYGLIYRFFPSLYTTIAIYAISFAIAAGFVYLTVRLITKNNWFALGLTIIYLSAYIPALNQPYFEDWATPYIAIALYLTAARRFKAATLVWLLAMMFKEYIGIAVATLGAVLVLSGLIRQFRPIADEFNFHNEWQFPANKPFGLSWVGMGLIWFGVGYFGIMRTFQPVWVNMFMFKELGASDSAVILSLVTKPYIIVQRILSPVGVEYFSALVVPLAFLSLIGIEFVLPLAPIVLINFLPDQSMGVSSIYSHYTTLFEPFLFAAAALGFVRVEGWARDRSSKIRIGVVMIALGLMLVPTAIGIRLHLYNLRESLVYTHILMLHSNDVRTIFSLLPQTASVGADEHLLPFLADREIAAHLDNVTIIRPDYIICDPLYSRDLPQIREEALALGWRVFFAPFDLFYNSRQWEALPTEPCAPGNYQLIARSGSVALYHRSD